MRKLFFVNILVLVSSFSFSQNIIGNWSGNISVNGNQIPIVFHFYNDSLGKVHGKWDSPSQNAKNLPCSEIDAIDDSITIGLKIISGFYKGKFITKDSIAGLWHQGNGQLALNISKTNGSTFEPPKRPQTPKPPFNYLSEDVVYSNADNSMKYGATFTKPKGPLNKKYPTVLLITGSGKQDRDENIFEHKPFAVIADYLTKRGIAVLRVDDRGMGETTGNFDTSSSADFANDVEAGIKYLESRKDVNVKRIGLIGHSEGGMIAPMVAARDKDVSFIVLLAGTGVPGSVINDYQNSLPMQSAGMSEVLIQKFLDLHRAIVNAAISYVNVGDYKNEVSKIYYDWKKKQSPETLKALIHGTDEEAIASFQSRYILFHSKWWKFFLTHDPAKDLEKLSIPVLALNGSKDIQVDPKINLPAIESALKKSKSKNYKTIELPGLNHLFQHCRKCTIGEYGELEETFAPEALKVMGDWIEDVVK
ncbi:alpha/beta hydrolase [Ginsengibacter hankyongi]|uniref:Alpha/beta hydrolase n=1 Tax=Ginsengibacter hankyongi TaxID=2607284 RepID=A0A5J5IKQ1_9BACT|nr:alpha/beta hydrolase [Ginsengibacter hankyongi]KAA9041665.1 alpha/beta hydrolase [Ginsengibacter hankyongi]